MRFIFEEGAPNIPLEILNAQKSDRLVIFCGAGISIPAGLPTFSDLVEKIYKGLNADKTTEEEFAIKNNQYDVALNLLEQKIKPSLVREKLIQNLELNDVSDLSTHKAILDISKTKNGKYRLLTTNVDLGFKLVIKKYDIIAQIHSAPAIPSNPKAHKWESIVHLHGIIDKVNDPENKHLVFTSADFGTAYLIEGWASKFVTELFQQFTVLFVGYSVNDPIFRYIVDAIAGEKLKGNKYFNQPYIVTDDLIPQIESKQLEWKYRGIEPIFYSSENNHFYLHETFKKWAIYSQNVLNEKIQIIQSIGKNPPVEPDCNDLIDIIKEEENINAENVTGNYAKIFRDIKGHIDWLDKFDKEGLFSAIVLPTKLFPVCRHPLTNTITPNSLTRYLWEWIAEHLENNSVVIWVIKNGCHLHPDLKKIIRLKLNNTNLKKSYMNFWHIILFYDIKVEDHNMMAYEVLSELKKDVQQTIIPSFINAIKPKFNITQGYSFLDEEKEKTDKSEDANFKAEIEIDFNKWHLEELKKLECYPKRLIELLIPVTTELNNALYMWEYIGHADEYRDRSDWDMSSIAPHVQNHFFNSWAILIEFCRDLWEATWDVNRAHAISVLNLWKTFKYPTFRRLVFYIYSIQDVVKPDTALDYLLENDAWWLWSHTTRLEKFRLLSKISSILSVKANKKLFKVIYKGPPRKMYSKNLTEEMWAEHVEHTIWFLLSKLKSYGAKFDKRAETKLAKLSKIHPTWNLQGGEKDEFSCWMETTIGYKTDIQTEEIFLFSASELVNKLIEENHLYSKGRMDSFRKACQKESNKAVEILLYLKNQAIWDNKIWHAALVGVSESSDASWTMIASLLLDAPPQFFSTDAWAVAQWAKKASENIEPYSEEEKYFWQIANILFNTKTNNETDLFSLFSTRDVVNIAINQPIGIITEALMRRFSLCKLNSGDTIKDQNYLNCMDKIILGENEELIFGRILLASRLPYFYSVDRDWTKTFLLPLFEWGASTEAEVMWQGYLWSPQISIELAFEIKRGIISTLEKWSSAKDKNTNNKSYQLYALFTLICLNFPELYTVQEKQRVLKQVEHEGLGGIARYIFNFMNRDNADNYWNNIIKPFIVQCWPKENIYANKETSNYFALISIQLNNLFPDAIQTLKSFIDKFNDFNCFLHELGQKDLPDKMPNDTLELLSIIFASNREYFNKDNLCSILNRIQNAQSALKDDPRFISLSEILN